MFEIVETELCDRSLFAVIVCDLQICLVVSLDVCLKLWGLDCFSKAMDVSCFMWLSSTRVAVKLELNSTLETGFMLSSLSWHCHMTHGWLGGKTCASRGLCYDTWVVMRVLQGGCPMTHGW